MKNPAILIFGGVGLLLGAIVLSTTLYTVQETDQVIITQFGRPVGNAVTNSGLHMKLPFVQDVNRLEKRILAWDGPPSGMPTKDKTYIEADAFGRWRIDEPKKYFLRLRDERRARSRLDDILGSEIRNAIAKHQLIELVRTTKGREAERDETLSNINTNMGVWKSIEKGRAKVEEEIFANAAPKLAEFGIELLDVRFKRINYNESVREQIYQRMISERNQIADRFRSEGAEEAAKILGNKDKDLQEIESEAYRRIQELEGAADAKATSIYAGAYDQSPESAEFYEFVKTMETYKVAFSNETTLVLGTDSEFFKFLRSASPEDSGK
jgi:modulator of FtsH protease HflC